MIHRRRLLPLLPLLLLALPEHGAAKTVRLLTIGNSFSRNATNHLGALAEAGGHELIHESIVVSGASLELHSEKALLHAREPQNKDGLYASGRSLVQHLQQEPWDFVTLQQASIKSHDFATFEPHGSRLAALIRQHAPGARLLVHQTWAYRVDDPRFTKPSGKPGEPATQEQLYRGLTSAYDQLARLIGARVIPVGDAFFAADTDPQWGYQPDPAPFDPKTAIRPALPHQTHSLHVGWRWTKARNSDKISPGMDGHHANLAGEYLGACVWYETLFGDSPVGSAHLPEGLDAAHARFLQETAHRAAQARLAGEKSAAAAKVRALPGLVAFWDFQEEGGQPRRSGQLALQERKGPIARVGDGFFGPHAARIQRGQWLMIPRADIGALDIHGKEAQVTVAAWIWREDKASWQALAGVWDETRKKRQYCLFLNAPRGTRADEMVRHPLANRIHGHVSAIGGPTPGEQFCITYSSGATEIPFGTWQTLVMRYDGKESRVYVNGRLDSLEHYNPFPYPDGLHDGGGDGADFTVGAVHRGGEWGNFFGGRIGGLAIFSRALSDEEIAALPR